MWKLEPTRLVAPLDGLAVQGIDTAIRAAKGEFLARAARRTLKLTSDLMTSACSAGASYLTGSQLGSSVRRPRHMELLNVRANDGSRQFAALPQTASWRKLRRHLEALAGVRLTDFVTDSVSEGWLDFTYDGQRLTVNDQFGQYWFFVDDPAAPDELLRRVAEHCHSLLHAPAV